MNRAVRATTLRTPTSVRGIGLFTGLDATLTIRPATPGTGFIFRRADLSVEIPATIDHLSTLPVHPAFEGVSPRNTSLALDPSDPSSPRVLTTEHAMGALVGLGITDAILELDAMEVPIDDGSADDITRAIRKAGLEVSDVRLDAIAPTTPLRIGDPNAFIELSPLDHPCYSYEIDYGDQSPFPPHAAAWMGDPEMFAHEIAPARTFSLDREVAPLRAAGLFTRFEPSDLLVLDTQGPIANAWRHPHEPARHKVLDLMGDLALAGVPLHARVSACRSGHAMNHQMARAIRDMVDAV